MRKLSQIILLVIFVFLAGSIFLPSVFSMENESEPLKIVSLGDSITYGWNLDQDRSKPSEKAFPYLIADNALVTNISYPGWTSTQLLNTMKTMPQVIPALQEADVVTLNIGSNDLLQAAGIQQILAGGVPVVPTPEMEQKIAAASAQLAANLQEIATLIKAQTDAPLIMYNIYNPFGPSTDPFAASLNMLGEQISKNVNERVIIPIAYNSGALVADANTAFNGKQSQYILPGDIHPNETGHMALASLAEEILSHIKPAPNPEYGWVEMDGKRYYLDINGEKLTGLQQIDDGGWYFFDKTGVMQTGWIYHNGKWYFFSNPDGLMVTGWIKDKGAWYFLDQNNGVMKTGWVQDKGAWYYLAPGNGAMKTGWLHVSGKWYYLEPKSGAMKTGWLLDKGSWYYLEQKNGQMKSGWIQENGKWYYLDSTSGAMKTKWIHINKKWYFLDGTGAMKTGWIQDKNNWYFLDVKSGAMKTGWQLLNNSWYYFYESGSMAYNTKINGYKVGGNGLWIN